MTLLPQYIEGDCCPLRFFHGVESEKPDTNQGQQNEQNGDLVDDQ
jgi:hypothetical protein